MQRLDKDIKDKVFHRFYLLYGEEDYLKKMYKNSLKKQYFMAVMILIILTLKVRTQIYTE